MHRAAAESRQSERGENAGGYTGERDDNVETLWLRSVFVGQSPHRDLCVDTFRTFNLCV